MARQEKAVITTVDNETKDSAALLGARQIARAPWVFVFLFSNVIKEEIQYRGLFLEKYQEFFGAGSSNLLQALPFAFAHLGETYSPEMLVFFVIVLLLGLGFEALAQKTNSLVARTIVRRAS